MAARPSFLNTLYGIDGISFGPEVQENQGQENAAQANGYVYPLSTELSQIKNIFYSGAGNQPAMHGGNTTVTTQEGNKLRFSFRCEGLRSTVHNSPQVANGSN